MTFVAMDSKNMNLCCAKVKFLTTPGLHLLILTPPLTKTKNKMFALLHSKGMSLQIRKRKQWPKSSVFRREIGSRACIIGIITIVVLGLKTSDDYCDNTDNAGVNLYFIHFIDVLFLTRRT